jgi:hypothetical protein
MNKSLYKFLLIIIIIVLLFVIDYTIFKRLELYTSQISIINLVLYSNNEEYDEMYKLTKNYYKKFNNVTTIYYKFNDNNTEEYELVDDILNIKGTETYVPGILDKTIKAFQYVNNNYKFDYIIRSNISTIINFDLLCQQLETNPIEYGGKKLVLWIINIPDGIIDTTYFGTEYAAGTSIILSKNTVNEIINNKDKLLYNIIDDVSLKLLIDKELNHIKQNYISESQYFFVPNLNSNSAEIIELIKNKNYIFYRNRQHDRKIDLSQMRIIIDYLQNPNNY